MGCYTIPKKNLKILNVSHPIENTDFRLIALVMLIELKLTCKTAETWRSDIAVLLAAKGFNILFKLLLKDSNKDEVSLQILKLIFFSSVKYDKSGENLMLVEPNVTQFIKKNQQIFVSFVQLYLRKHEANYELTKVIIFLWNNLMNTLVWSKRKVFLANAFSFECSLEEENLLKFWLDNVGGCLFPFKTEFEQALYEVNQILPETLADTKLHKFYGGFCEQACLYIANMEKKLNRTNENEYNQLITKIRLKRQNCFNFFIEKSLAFLKKNKILTVCSVINFLTKYDIHEQGNDEEYEKTLSLLDIILTQSSITINPILTLEVLKSLFQFDIRLYFVDSCLLKVLSCFKLVQEFTETTILLFLYFLNKSIDLRKFAEFFKLLITQKVIQSFDDTILVKIEKSLVSGFESCLKEQRTELLYLLSKSENIPSLIFSSCLSVMRVREITEDTLKIMTSYLQYILKSEGCKVKCSIHFLKTSIGVYWLFLNEDKTYDLPSSLVSSFLCLVTSFSNLIVETSVPDRIDLMFRICHLYNLCSISMNDELRNICFNLVSEDNIKLVNVDQFITFYRVLIDKSQKKVISKNGNRIISKIKAHVILYEERNLLQSLADSKYRLRLLTDTDLDILHPDIASQILQNNESEMSLKQKLKVLQNLCKNSSRSKTIIGMTNNLILSYLNKKIDGVRELELERRFLCLVRVVLKECISDLSSVVESLVQSKNMENAEIKYLFCVMISEPSDTIIELTENYRKSFKATCPLKKLLSLSTANINNELTRLKTTKIFATHSKVFWKEFYLSLILRKFRTVDISKDEVTLLLDFKQVFPTAAIDMILFRQLTHDKRVSIFLYNLLQLLEVPKAKFYILLHDTLAYRSDEAFNKALEKYLFKKSVVGQKVIRFLLLNCIISLFSNEIVEFKVPVIYSLLIKRILKAKIIEKEKCFDMLIPSFQQLELPLYEEMRHIPANYLFEVTTFLLDFMQMYPFRVKDYIVLLLNIISKMKAYVCRSFCVTKSYQSRDITTVVKTFSNLNRILVLMKKTTTDKIYRFVIIEHVRFLVIHKMLLQKQLKDKIYKTFIQEINLYNNILLEKFSTKNKDILSEHLDDDEKAVLIAIIGEVNE